MSFLPDKENSVDLHYSNHVEGHVAGRHGRTVHSKSVSEDPRPKGLRKPLGNVNLQHPLQQSVANKGKDKAPLKPVQCHSESDTVKCAEKKLLQPKVQMKPIKSKKIEKEEGSTVDEVSSSLNSLGVASSNVDGDPYPDIEQPAFRSQHTDDYSDIWAADERPDSYLEALLGWRPALFSMSHSCNTPDIPDPPSPTISSALNYYSSPAVNRWAEEKMESPLSLPDIALPQLPDLIVGEDDDDDDGDTTINDDLLYFSALN